jgi:DNA-binding transcriptional regulator YhcF (GntR family)
MGLLGRIMVLRYLSYALDLIAITFLIYALYEFLYPFILLIGRGTAVKFSTETLVSILTLLSLAIIILRVNEYIKTERNLLIDSLNKELLGTIDLYGTITMKELSGKMKMSSDTLEKYLAKLAREGIFKGTINGKTMVVSRSIEINTEPAETKAIRLNEMKIDKLKKLEELRKEGKINEDIFKKLKEEYEKERQANL